MDKEVGLRLKRRRKALSITQQRLAEGLGISFQQVQKYETGRNRLSASRLQDVSQILNVPVSYFF